MRNVSFSTQGETAGFQQCAGPAESAAGFVFKEGWIDVETSPFVYCAGLLILGAEDAGTGPLAGGLMGMGCMGGTPGVISNTALEECFAGPAGSRPVTWWSPERTSPWRLSSFRIRMLLQELPGQWG